MAIFCGMSFSKLSKNRVDMIRTKSLVSLDLCLNLKHIESLKHSLAPLAMFVHDFCSIPFKNESQMDGIRQRTALYDLFFTIKNYEKGITSPTLKQGEIFKEVSRLMHNHLVRFERSAQPVIQKLSRQVRQLTEKALELIDLRQRNCSNARLLVCPTMYATIHYGLGSMELQIVLCLSMALAFDARMVLDDTKKSHQIHGREPIHFVCPGDDLSVNSHQNIAAVPRATFPQMVANMAVKLVDQDPNWSIPHIPRSIADGTHLKEVVENPVDWYIGVLLQYLVRLDEGAKQNLEDKKTRLSWDKSGSGGRYSLQVRGTDKCILESFCPPIAKYVYILNAFDAIMTEVDDLTPVAPVFLGTDDVKVLEDIKTTRSRLNFTAFHEVSLSYTKVKPIPFGKFVAPVGSTCYGSTNGSNYIMDVLIDWHLHASTDLTIGTQSSNFGNVIRFLKASQSASSSFGFYSLDFEWNTRFVQPDPQLNYSAIVDHADEQNHFLGFDKPRSELVLPPTMKDSQPISLSMLKGDIISSVRWPGEPFTRVSYFYGAHGIVLGQNQRTQEIGFFPRWKVEKQTFK